MIETGLNDNQNIVLDYLKSSESNSPFANIYALWTKCFDYCMGYQFSDYEAEVYEAYSGLDNQEKYEVLQEYGRWGINGGLD
ncbi:hypothetical protein C7H83_10185 [Tetragenococcus halophilus]|uniref:Uncharacterized protein n=1 Tax=Tetragenococcus halophilus TaxID=51669 RepID=A0A3G5FKI6_TETHA|nr:hypothetical protein [Tetragenococcus halophilus]AYW50809.1 hypothetical protein C7H83_10185 [Tetragenococcus halophilus]GBD64892.1 hypothetical protein TEHD23766T_2319 [Tetragenococcus halophilus subsp. flandriensis]GMA08918.1 hypothetical protein GCM10025886_20690 [Tetragenococcus halophilus subsp. flandriensis]